MDCFASYFSALRASIAALAAFATAFLLFAAVHASYLGLPLVLSASVCLAGDGGDGEASIPSVGTNALLAAPILVAPVSIVLDLAVVKMIRRNVSEVSTTVCVTKG